jgi:hypothetical protein
MAYHDPAANAFFAILERDATQDVKMRQTCYPLDYLPEFLQTIDPARTMYLSQGSFVCPNRRIVNLAHISLGYSDLDTYNAPIAHLSEARTVDYIRKRCDEERIPDPSMIISSGRGFYGKWLYEKPIPRSALPRWNAVQSRIVDALSDCGADPNARDASRVLRVVGTTNEKTGNRVKIIWSNDVAGSPVRYGFDELADEVLPFLRPSHHLRIGERGATDVREKKKTRSLIHPFTKNTLWWARLEDLRKLLEMRGHEAGAPVGERNLFLHLAVVAASWCLRPDQLREEILALGHEFAPSLTQRQWFEYCSPTIWRVKATWDSRTEERYRYGTETLIQMLRVTPVEMRHLSTLIDSTEAARRHREREETRRRALGAVPRDEYLTRAADRASQAREMAASGLSYTQIGERLGVSRRHTIRLALS